MLATRILQLLTYEMDDLAARFLGTWDAAWTRVDGDLFLFRYLPTRYGSDEAQQFIWDFKNNHPQAVSLAVFVTVLTLRLMEPAFRKYGKGRPWYFVAIPGHARGKRNVPGETLGERLAAEFEWVEHLPGALVRTETVPKSATASASERPSMEDHLRTIAYHGPVFREHPNVLLFDDVITRGATSRACRRILRDAISPRMIKGLFLGRTSYD